MLVILKILGLIILTIVGVFVIICLLISCFKEIKELFRKWFDGTKKNV